MDDLSKARRKWKRAEDAAEEAQARLKNVGGKEGNDAARAATMAKRELEEAEAEEREDEEKVQTVKKPECWLIASRQTS